MTTRRQLLRGALFGGAAAATGVASSGCVRWIDPAPLLDVPAPANGLIALELCRLPDLAPIGGALTVRSPGLENILVFHAGENSYAALSASCTHAGCPLGSADGYIECPCHGARFAPDGSVLRPPAVQALRTYKAYVDSTSGDLVIDVLAGTAGFPPLVNGAAFFAFADFPQLTSFGGSVAGTPQGAPNPIVLVAKSDGTFAAVDAVCTHLGCTVEPTAAGDVLNCPCHGARFALDGAVLQGPATLPLKTYVATADATGVTVQLS